MNPLDRLTTIISELMGKEPSDPDVLEAVVEVVMAIREPSDEMVWAGSESIDTCTKIDPCDKAAQHCWKDMIDALLT